MKKAIFIVLASLMAFCAFAQEFEVIKQINFGEPIRYYEKWNQIEGGHPGIYQIQSWKGQLILLDNDKHCYFNLDNPNQKREYNSLFNLISFCQKDEILVLGEKGSINKIDIYTKSGDISKPDYSIDYTDIKDTFDFTLYYT